MSGYKGLYFLIYALILAGTAESLPSLFGGYEPRYERFEYRFENPSSFNTPLPVPHNFVQSYEANGNWGMLGVQYKLLGWDSETRFGIAVERTTKASDIDTFFQSGGNVITSGTRGGVEMQSLFISQRFDMGDWHELQFENGFRYQRDDSTFLPSPFFITQSSPPSQVIGFTSDEEFTLSQVLDLEIGVWREVKFSQDWSLKAGARFLPLVYARLTVTLPQKYPGTDLTFTAAGYGVTPGIIISRTGVRFPVRVSAYYGHTWSYQKSDRFIRKSAGVEFNFGYTWNP